MDEVHHVAATVVQRWWRAKMARRRFLAMRRDAEYRSRVVQELLETEKRYVAGLRVLVEGFEEPLRARLAAKKSDGAAASSSSSSKQLTASDGVGDGELLSGDECRLLFGQLRIIMGYNMVLLEQLEERVATWGPNSLLSDVFLALVPFMRTYSFYVQSYPEALALMTTVGARPEWKKFERATLRKWKMRNESLPSLLITPVQRVPRYQLLLRDLLKRTPDTHPDHANLLKTLSAIESTAEAINEVSNVADRMARVTQIAASIEGVPFPLLAAGRRFIRDGVLQRVLDGGDKETPAMVFLFSDTVVCCAEPPDSDGQRRYLSHMSLEFTSVDRLDDTAFSLLRQGRDGELQELSLRAPDAASRQQWVRDVNEQLDELRKVLATITARKNEISQQKAEQAKAMIDAQYTSLKMANSSRTGERRWRSSLRAPLSARETSTTSGDGDAGDGSTSPASSASAGSVASRRPQTDRPSTRARGWSASLTEADRKNWRRMSGAEKLEATRQAEEEVRRLRTLEAHQETASRAKAIAGKSEIRNKMMSLSQSSSSSLGDSSQADDRSSSARRLSYREARASLKRSKSQQQSSEQVDEPPASAEQSEQAVDDQAKDKDCLIQ
jgi:RhoGEF domain/IQ calmodulin-binding motif